MSTTDLNGPDDWSLEAVRRRYRAYARDLGVLEPLPLEPKRVTEGPAEWIYPAVEQILDGVQANDAACIQMAIELVCTDARFTFGKVFKDRAANLLRRVPLTPAQSDQLRTRMAEMMRSGFVPPEFRCYARLLLDILPHLKAGDFYGAHRRRGA